MANDLPIDEAYIKGKSAEELLKDLYGRAQPGSTVHEQLKAAIQVRLIDGLRQSLDELRHSQERNAASAGQLAQRVYWLNWALTVATVAMLFVGAVQSKLISW